MTEVTGNQIAALLIPTAVTLVSAYDENGKPCVATIAWVMPISHEPSMMAVSIRPGGRTSNAMAASGCFSINVLPATPAAKNIALVCGAKHGVDDRIAASGVHIERARACAAPCIAEALSWVECELLEHKAYGDHELIIGRTLAARTSADVAADGTVAPSAALLMSQRGAFGSFAPFVPSNDRGE